MDLTDEYNPQNFQVVDDIIKLLLKTKSESLNLYVIKNYDSDKLYSEFYNLKKKLQLCLNHCNNKKLYESCLLKDYEPFSSLHPDAETEIGEILKDFIQHYCTILKFETGNEIQEMIIPENCFYCENPIASDDETCSICLAPVADMPTKFRNTNHNADNVESSFSERDQNIVNNNENDVKENPVTTAINGHNTNFYNDGKPKRGDYIPENDNNIMKNNENRVNIEMEPKSETQVTKLKSFHELLINNKDKWLCEMCQCLNSFQQSQCQGCFNSCRDKCLWVCSRCDLINHINTSICSACDGSNKNVERFLMWKCWKPHCEQLNNPDYEFCKKCLLQRNAPKSLSDLVERRLENGKILKFWICEKCWKYNNDNYRNCEGKNCGHSRYAKAVKGNAIHGQINIDQKELAKDNNKIELNANQWECEQCTFINENCNNKCAICNTQSKSHNSSWQCWKGGCGKKNNGSNIFCQKCKLDRNPPDPVTKLVKCYAGNEIIEIWICDKCKKENRKGDSNCDRKNCGNARLAVTEKDIATCVEININQKELAKDDNKIELNANQWQCEQCTLINENNIYQCPACKWEWKRNCWECWNVNCKAKNKGANVFCQECKLDRNPPDPKTKLVKDYARNEIKEIWICKKCTKKNKKDDAKCAGTNCGAYKFYEGINSTNKDIINGTASDHNPNYDKFQKAKRNNENPSNTDSWKCWFSNCKQVNNAADEFCRNCRLSRYGIWDRGALVKLLTKNGDINDIWICHKCFKYNELSVSRCCGKSCNISRF